MPADCAVPYDVCEDVLGDTGVQLRIAIYMPTFFDLFLSKTKKSRRIAPEKRWFCVEKWPFIFCNSRYRCAKRSYSQPIGVLAVSTSAIPTTASFPGISLRYRSLFQCPVPVLTACTAVMSMAQAVPVAGAVVVEPPVAVAVVAAPVVVVAWAPPAMVL